MSRLNDAINRIVKRHPRHYLARLWAWAKKGSPRKRLRAIRAWARRHQLLSHSKARRQRFWKIVHEATRQLRKLKPKPQPSDGWPADVHITELFNNDNGLHNHVHVASTSHADLVALGNIAIRDYGGAGAVREMLPFDTVECVHVSTSWHYRDSSAPYTPRACANRGDGLAMDCGFARRQEFGDEIKRRYGADVSDF